MYKYLTLIIYIFPLVANAEYAKMVAANSYCKVEVRSGEFASGNPLDLPNVLANNRVDQGESWTAAEGIRICARRSGNPLDCNSGFTNWVCISPYKDIDPGKERTDQF
jgi:hypothetical protein